MSTLAEFARDVAADIVGLQREISRMKTMMSSGQMHMGGMRTVTLAAGVMNTNQWGYYELVPQAGTTDDLDTINNGIDGKIIGIRVNDNANTITVKDGVGNICLPNGDIDLDDVCFVLPLIYDDDSSMWILFSVDTVGAGTLLSLTDTPGSFTAGAYLRVDGGATAVEFTGVVNFGAVETLTLSGGSVARTSTTSNYIIAAETGTADDLDSITGGSDGDVIIVCPDSGDTITAKDNTGNLQLSGDFAMDNPADVLTLRYKSSISRWCEITSSGNA